MELPPGYTVKGLGTCIGALWCDSDWRPVVWITPPFSESTVERIAWDHHRRRTLRVIVGGLARP